MMVLDTIFERSEGSSPSSRTIFNLLVMSNYITAKVVLNMSLEDKLKDLWHRLVNKKHFGMELIPLEVPSSEIPQRLKDIHWFVNCSNRIEIEVKLYDNGDMEVIPQSKIYTADLSQLKK